MPADATEGVAKHSSRLPLQPSIKLHVPVTAALVPNYQCTSPRGWGSGKPCAIDWASYNIGTHSGNCEEIWCLVQTVVWQGFLVSRAHFWYFLVPLRCSWPLAPGAAAPASRYANGSPTQDLNQGPSGPVQSSNHYTTAALCEFVFKLAKIMLFDWLRSLPNFWHSTFYFVWIRSGMNEMAKWGRCLLRYRIDTRKMVKIELRLQWTLAMLNIECCEMKILLIERWTFRISWWANFDLQFLKLSTDCHMLVRYKKFYISRLNHKFGLLGSRI